MSFSQLIQKRYSVRNYTTQQVEEEKLNAILEAGRLAPTAANLQPVKVIVVKSCEAMTKIKKAANIYNAPLALIVCADHKTAWTRPFDEKQTTDIDATIITDHMMIQATELGLGSVWICYFKPDVLKT
ncbi:MAG: nitroreductase family protein, partial [Ruminococcus sp.]|nr:nitroreductase family protein [Ruminococcus sp.]